MIPQFPEFKKLELSDKDQIESFTKRFPPYSDFNFVSMFSWDIQGDMRVSILNDNLVVRFNDYITSKPFYSFLGTNKVNETVESLLEYSRLFGGGVSLKLVPEDCIKELDTTKFVVAEDRDHFDYILPTALLKEYDTRRTYSKRKAVNGFLRKFNPQIEVLDLSDLETQKKIFKLINKKADEDGKTIDNEILAITRLISTHSQAGLVPLGVFLEGELVGFYFSEIMENGQAMGHFWKADTDISQYIYSYLMQAKAKMLHDRGATHVNIEQDLGIESLRKWKSSYGQETFLKKYTISFA